MVQKLAVFSLTLIVVGFIRATLHPHKTENGWDSKFLQKSHAVKNSWMDNSINKNCCLHGSWIDILHVWQKTLLQVRIQKQHFYGETEG